MTDYDLAPSPLTKLPLRNFEHYRVSNYDAAPTKLRLVGSSSSSKEDGETAADAVGGQAPLPAAAAAAAAVGMRACAVCHNNESRYTCPRCEIPYCSIGCYRAHSSSSNSSTSSSSCTEKFYHDRVQSVLQLERKAKKQDTYQLINRVYAQHNNNGFSSSSNFEQEAEGEEDPNCLDEEDIEKLFELLVLLEQSDEGFDGDDAVEQQQQQQQHHQTQQKLTSLLAKSPKLKADFEAAVERGEVQEILLQSWDPWWRPVFTSSPSRTDSIATEESITTTNSSHPTITLDERLLRVKPLESLLPKTTTASSTSPPDLTFNLLDILYSIARTLRLYHGAANCMASHETVVEAAVTMMQESHVLSRDARYECLEEAMMDLIMTNHNKPNANNKETAESSSTTINNAEWTLLLLEDVSLMMENRRLIGRALFEALDILRAAISSLKNRKNGRQQKQTARTEATRASNDDVNEIVTDLRRKRKKLEFFLSWSQHNNNNSQAVIQLPNDIRAWVNHWTTTTTRPAADNNNNVDVGCGGVDDNDRRLKAVQSLLLDDEEEENLRQPQVSSETNKYKEKSSFNHLTRQQQLPVKLIQELD